MKTAAIPSCRHPAFQQYQGHGGGALVYILILVIEDVARRMAFNTTTLAHVGQRCAPRAVAWVVVTAMPQLVGAA